MVSKLEHSNRRWTVGGKELFDGALLCIRDGQRWTTWRAVVPQQVEHPNLAAPLWFLAHESGTERSQAFDVHEITVEQMSGDQVLADDLDIRWA